MLRAFIVAILACLAACTPTGPAEPSAGASQGGERSGASRGVEPAPPPEPTIAFDGRPGSAVWLEPSFGARVELSRAELRRILAATDESLRRAAPEHQHLGPLPMEAMLSRLRASRHPVSGRRCERPPNVFSAVRFVYEDVHRATLWVTRSEASATLRVDITAAPGLEGAGRLLARFEVTAADPSVDAMVAALEAGLERTEVEPSPSNGGFRLSLGRGGASNASDAKPKVRWSRPTLAPSTAERLMACARTHPDAVSVVALEVNAEGCAVWQPINATTVDLRLADCVCEVAGARDDGPAGPERLDIVFHPDAAGFWPDGSERPLPAIAGMRTPRALRQQLAACESRHGDLPAGGVALTWEIDLDGAVLDARPESESPLADCLVAAVERYPTTCPASSRSYVETVRIRRGGSLTPLLGDH